MLIRDMFRKPIDREIQGVIIVGQGEETNVSQELDEYEAKESYRLEFMDPAAAAQKNRSVRESPYSRTAWRKPPQRSISLLFYLISHPVFSSHYPLFPLRRPVYRPCAQAPSFSLTEP